jgi:colicin import membrane protein
MTATSPRAFMLSATLHAAIAGLLLLLSYAASHQARNLPKVLELVAGEGDNYAARAAPALGVEGGVKVDVPAAPQPEPPRPQPVKTEPVPLAPAPTPPTKVTPAPAKDAEPAPPNFKRTITRQLIRAESQLKKDKAREAAAAAKEAKRLADEAKKMTKAEFDAKNKKADPKSAPTKIAKIDAEGIAKGVVGGSTENKTGGAGGKALTSDNNDVLAAYDALFKQRLRREFEAPPAMSDTLKVQIEIHSNVDGSITGARVVKTSGSREFDRAVLDAIRRVRMPARPDRKGETVQFVFSAREKDEG